VRLLCEIFIVAALIYFGWEKPFRDWLPGTRKAEPPVVTAAPAAPAPRPQLRPLVRATATPSGDWMWDPAHRAALDRPAYDSKDASSRYKDAATSQKYWIDSRGVRHYESGVAPAPAPSSSP